jgi:mannonate dehydratase
LKGKNPDNIEDIWQTVNVSSYWRNGPILNTVLAGLDQALWDIKGKRAGMPVYQLLGGKSRFAVDCYGHASGEDFEELADSVREFKEKGFRHIRIQLGKYGSPHLSGEPDFRKGGFGLDSDTVMEIRPYMKKVPEMFEFVRSEFGDELEFLHDVHELLPPIEAINLAKELEQYRPFFIEDLFAPEDIGYYKILREQSSCAIAMGELFNNSHEWVGLITERLIDFVRIHISQIGGITPALKVARLAEWFNVRTAWHGPGNTSPVGHAGNAHIDLAIWNFGIQEQSNFKEETLEVFPGTPTIDNGYMHINEAPGFGIDINEELAAKYPLDEEPWYRPIVRRPDGTVVRP